MKKKKRRNKSKKAKEIIENENIIDLEMQKESRRQQLRAKAEASRRKRGVKSIKDQMMEEVAMGDMASEVYGYDNDYYVAGEANNAAVSKSSKRNRNDRAGGKKKKISPLQKKISFAVIVIVLIGMAVSVGNIVSLKIQENEAKAQIEELKLKKVELERQVGELGSDEYVEQQARNWLKMAKRGEIVYVLEDDELASDEEEQPDAIGGSKKGQ